jgi:hypothetical protein
MNTGRNELHELARAARHDPERMSVQSVLAVLLSNPDSLGYTDAWKSPHSIGIFLRNCRSSPLRDETTL